MNEEQKKIMKGIIEDTWDIHGQDILNTFRFGGDKPNQHSISESLVDLLPPPKYEGELDTEEKEAMEEFNKLPYGQMLKFIRDCGPFGE